jgi:AhpC/TSA family
MVIGHESMAVPLVKRDAVHIFGQVTTDQDRLELLLIFFRHPLMGLNDSGTIRTVDVPIDKSGHFMITFQAAEPGRVTVVDKATSSYLFDRQLFEPGDSIGLNARVVVDSNGGRFVGDLSGAGAAKYKCSWALGLSSDDDLLFRLALYNRRGKGIYEVADSIISAQVDILDRFRGEMSAFSYDVMKADIVGSVYGKLVWGLFGSVGHDFFKKTYDDSTLTAMRGMMTKFATYTKINLPENCLAMSEFYVDFVYRLARVELALKNPRTPFGLSDVCAQLEKDVSGDLMSVCLAFALLKDDNLLMGIDTTISAGEYTSCLEQAENAAITPWVKDMLASVLRVRGKGAPALDFCLPADSTGRLVRLSDFQGKVVLLDIWSYQCTGCTLFSQAFHRAIFPRFKDSAFEVVSIMTSPTPKEKYMMRLRSTTDPRFGARLSVYTFPDYVNLFGGQGVAMGEAINQHYHINGYPYILLIDKRGRIFSSTVPFFEDEGSKNVAKLTELIRQALEDKSF